jgi:hypothetical protein
MLLEIPLDDRQHNQHQQKLIYSSRRTDDFRSILYFQLLGGGDELPATLKRVHLEIMLAGWRFRRVFSAVPFLTYSFAWDRKNVLGQPEYGLVDAHG